MLCINPFRKPSVEFGCGQCISCRVNRRRTWTARILLESTVYRESSFITLTYDDEHLPQNGSLSKAHWREFTKGIGYRYFGCGEYGSRTFRPHYHFVLFGLSVLDAESLARQRWPFGLVSVRPFCREHAAYISGYVVKKLHKADDPRLSPGQIPEFCSMSRRPGIGVPGIRPFADWSTTLEGCKEVGRRRDVPYQVKIDGHVYPFGRTLRQHLRSACDIPSDDPVRTAAREAEFRLRKSDPVLSARVERRRTARYEILKARARRPHGTL